MKEKFLLKDHLFNEIKVTYLADLFVVANKNFNKKKFVFEVLEKFPELELKARIGWMTEMLTQHLPEDVPEALELIAKALPPPLDLGKADDDFGDYIFTALGECVVRNGCNKKYLKQSLETLREITMRFSMEDAMRAFLNNFPTETLAFYDKWVTDKNYHVRRLVSESLRPSLPWSVKIGVNYKLPIKYLDILHADRTRYVTRSLANHLNDISKIDPSLVITTLKKWRKYQLQTEVELEWMTRHALRTLIKQGNQEALNLLGFSSIVPVTVSNLLSQKNISRGEKLKFDFVIESPVGQNLLVDYVIDFVKQNGSTKPKVFKIKKLKIESNVKVLIEKSHHLKADAATFKLNPGIHTLTIQINGQKLAATQFEVH